MFADDRHTLRGHHGTFVEEKGLNSEPNDGKTPTSGSGHLCWIGSFTAATVSKPLHHALLIVSKPSKPDSCDAAEPDSSSGRLGQIDDPACRKRAAVVDPYDDGAAVRLVGDPNARAERPVAMGRREGSGVEALSAGCPVTGKSGSIPGGESARRGDVAQGPPGPSMVMQVRPEPPMMRVGLGGRTA